MTAGARAGASADAHDADATASTLSSALGRRHMKSWMAAPGNAPAAPVAPAALAAPLDPTPLDSATRLAQPVPSVPRKRGRPRKHPLPHVESQPAPSTPRKRGRPRKHPLPHVESQQHATQAASPTCTPSVERLPSSNSTSPQLANIITPHQRNGSHGNSNSDITVFPSPTPSEEDTHIGAVPVNETRTRPTTNVDSFDLASASPHLPEFPRRPSAPYAQVGSPLLGQQIVQPHHVLPSQRRSSYHGDWYSRGICMHLLNTFKASYTPDPRYPQDGVRLQVLEEAINMQDWAYVTLHQYYCLLSASPQSLPTSLDHNGNMATAFALIRDILDDNMHLSSPVIRFFCNFPFPADQIAATWPSKSKDAERHFVSFVNYSAMVGPLRLESEKRRVPPTPREFAKCLIISMTVQRLLLRSIIQSLWAAYPKVPTRLHFEDRIVRAWDHELSVFQQRRASGQLGGRQQANDELRAWSITFNQHTISLEAALRSQALAQANLASLPVHLQQQRQLQQPQATIAPATEGMAMSRQHQQPPHQVSRHHSASQMTSTARPRQGATWLLPRPGIIQPQQRVPNPSRFSLHQAHVRSPVLKATKLSSPVYYFWQGFVRKPQRLLHSNVTIERLTFGFSAKEMEFVAKAVASAPGAPDQRSLADENQKMIRLRCVKWASDELPEADVWAVAENSWIPYSYFTFNGKSLQLRKKLHNGKDLPVDLTGLLRSGENTLEVSVMSNSDDTAHRNYLVAIEFLGVMTQATIKKRCHQNRISIAATIADIKRKLSVSDTDDDDIAIVESTLTINLRDPFSASKICDTPVRSTACRHNECFDLDTFLETRPRKGDVSVADQWRCPICKADARPNVLVVDDFLVEVRKELERRGLLETRAIIVNQDGSWEPKPEERDPNGVQDHDTPEPAPLPAAVRAKAPVTYEIVDLDSD